MIEKEGNATLSIMGPQNLRTDQTDNASRKGEERLDSFNTCINRSEKTDGEEKSCEPLTREWE